MQKIINSSHPKISQLSIHYFSANNQKHHSNVNQSNSLQINMKRPSKLNFNQSIGKTYNYNQCPTSNKTIKKTITAISPLQPHIFRQDNFILVNGTMKADINLAEKNTIELLKFHLPNTNNDQRVLMFKGSMRNKKAPLTNIQAMKILWKCVLGQSNTLQNVVQLIQSIITQLSEKPVLIETRPKQKLPRNGYLFRNSSNQSSSNNNQSNQTSQSLSSDFSSSQKDSQQQDQLLQALFVLEKQLYQNRKQTLPILQQAIKHKIQAQNQSQFQLVSFRQRVLEKSDQNIKVARAVKIAIWKVQKILFAKKIIGIQQHKKKQKKKKSQQQGKLKIESKEQKQNKLQKQKQKQKQKQQPNQDIFGYLNQNPINNLNQNNNENDKIDQQDQKSHENVVKQEIIQQKNNVKKMVQQEQIQSQQEQINKYNQNDVTLYLQSPYPPVLTTMEQIKHIFGQQFYSRKVRNLIKVKKALPIRAQKFKIVPQCHLCRKILIKQQIFKCNNNPTQKTSESSYCSDPFIYHRMFYYPQLNTDFRNIQRYVHPYYSYHRDQYGLRVCNRCFCQSCFNSYIKIAKYNQDTKKDEMICCYCAGNCTCECCMQMSWMVRMMAFYIQIGGNFQQLEQCFLFPRKRDNVTPLIRIDPVLLQMRTFFKKRSQKLKKAMSKGKLRILKKFDICKQDKINKENGNKNNQKSFENGQKDYLNDQKNIDKEYKKEFIQISIFKDKDHNQQQMLKQVKAIVSKYQQKQTIQNKKQSIQNNSQSTILLNKVQNSKNKSQNQQKNQSNIQHDKFQEKNQLKHKIQKQTQKQEQKEKSLQKQKDIISVKTKSKVGYKKFKYEKKDKTQTQQQSKVYNQEIKSLEKQYKIIQKKQDCIQKNNQIQKSQNTQKDEKISQQKVKSNNKNINLNKKDQTKNQSLKNQKLKQPSLRITVLRSNKFKTGQKQTEQSIRPKRNRPNDKQQQNSKLKQKSIQQFFKKQQKNQNQNNLKLNNNISQKKLLQYQQIQEQFQVNNNEDINIDNIQKIQPYKRKLRKLNENLIQQNQNKILDIYDIKKIDQMINKENNKRIQQQEHQNKQINAKNMAKKSSKRQFQPVNQIAFKPKNQVIQLSSSISNDSNVIQQESSSQSSSNSNSSSLGSSVKSIQVINLIQQQSMQ